MAERRNPRHGVGRGPHMHVRKPDDKTIAAGPIAPEKGKRPQTTERQPRIPVPSAPSPVPVDDTLYDPRSTSDARRPVAVLAVIEGVALGRTFAVFEGETTIGREWFDHRRISRRHATIVHRNGVTAIRRDEKRNIVLVNGAPIDAHELGDGDTIELGQADGRVVLRFRDV